MPPVDLRAAFAQMTSSRLYELECEHLTTAVDVMSSVLHPDFPAIDPASPRKHGPYEVLAAVLTARRLVEELELAVREQIDRLDVTAPIGDRPPTALEVAAAPPGTRWTFRSPDGRGHATIVNGGEDGWTSFLTMPPHERPAWCMPLADPPEVSVPCQAERALKPGTA